MATLMRLGWISGIGLLTAAACASGGSDAPDGMPDAGEPFVASSCPEGEFATGFLADGTLACAPIDDTATAAMTEHCSLYLGWRDSCGGCTDDPSKWGRVSGIDCLEGAGLDNTCIEADLGGVGLPLFGLNTDGQVDGNDKFYVGMECAILDDAPVEGPCPEGSYLSAIEAGGTECVTAEAAIVDYLRQGCQIYFGWRDSCSGCATEPAKWGHAGSAGCTLGPGLDNTCTSPMLDQDLVPTFGLNTDGNVDDNDKFYLGFQCTGAAGTETSRTAACSAGELVVAIDAAGEVRCASPLPAAEAAIQDRCTLYFGWRDSCNGCTTAPSRWGRVGHTRCENGVGNTNTCASYTLEETEVVLFGLNTGGTVDGNDKFYLGLSCP